MMIKKVIAILASVVIVLAANLASAAPVLADGPGTWPSVPGLDREDFVKIAETGFGDPMNNYAWSMTYFKGDLYVGTGRNACWGVIHGLGFPPGLEEAMSEHITVPGDPPGIIGTKQFAENQRGEIWRYHRGEWQRVYRSCVFWAQGQGMWLTREMGFRKMITFTNKHGEHAIYAIAAGAIPPVNVILKSTDGTNWMRVRTPSLVCGAPPAMGNPRAMVVHKGKLYVGGGEARPSGGGAFIWATDDPVTVLPDDPDAYPCVEDRPCLPINHNWELVADFSAAGPGTNTAVGSLASFNGYLYAGVDNRETGFQIWRSTVGKPGPGDWTQIVNYGGGDMHNWRAACMDILKNKLYVGTLSLPGPPPDGSPGFLLPKGFELFRIDTEDNCQLLVGDPIPLVPPPGDGDPRMPSSGWPGGFANPLNFYCWSMQEHNGVLYVGSFDVSSFLQFLPIEELVELPELAEFWQAIEDNKEDIVICLEQIIAELEELGADEESIIEPFRLMLAALESEPTDWEGMLQVFIDYFAGADVWKTEDGIVWEPVTLNGFDNPNNYGFRSMVGGSLYVGTANPFQGLEVWQAPPTVPPPVGGEAHPVDRISLLAPWIAVGVVLAGGAIWYVLRRRRAQR